MLPWLWIFATGWAASILDCSPSMFLYEQWNRRYPVQNDKTLWIVGASSGIGREVALRRPASRMILSARSKDKLQHVASMIDLKTTNIQINPFDVTSPRQMRRAVRKLPSQVDAVWINAGIGGHLSTVESTNPSRVRHIFETNTLGPILLIQQIRKERPDVRHFIVTSSVAGHLAVPLSSAYAASKHALHGFLKSLAAEEPQLRIDVLCPGTVDTPFHPLARSSPSMKMPAARCAQLVTAAMQRRRPRKGYNEVWIATQPTLTAIYLNQLFPTLTQSLISRYVGPQRVAIWRKGMDVYDPLSWRRTKREKRR